MERRIRLGGNAEVLDLTVESAHQFFADETPVLRALDALLQVGLGYLRLGQSATELLGGEAQYVAWMKPYLIRD